MYYINDDLFHLLMKGATPLNVRSRWSLAKRFERLPVLRRFGSGEEIGASSGQREVRARLIDTCTPELVLEVWQAYRGERFASRPSEFYGVPRSLYESALAEMEAAR